MSAVHHMFAHHGNHSTHNVLMHEYNFEGFCGYGAKMDDKLVVYHNVNWENGVLDQFENDIFVYRLRDNIRSLEHIDYMECAQSYTSQSCKTQLGAPWVRCAIPSNFILGTFCCSEYM